MSETEDRRGILGRVKDVFFETPAPKEAAQERDDAPAETPAVPASPSDASDAGVPDASSADFDATYAQIAGAGDPKTDQVMGAYADMTAQGLNGPPLATAMTSLIRAIGADAKEIAVTIGKRMEAIGSAVAARRAAMQSRVAEHGSRAAALVTAAEEEIKELQARIATLTEQVARVKAKVQEHDAGEQADFAAYERQAARKTEELHGFAAFLAGAAAKT